MANTTSKKPKAKAPSLASFPKVMAEGKNRLSGTPDGITINATVKKGVVKTLDGVDATGAGLSVTMERKNGPGDTTICVVRYCRKYQNGEEICVEIPVTCDDKWFPRL